MGANGSFMISPETMPQPSKRNGLIPLYRYMMENGFEISPKDSLSVKVEFPPGWGLLVDPKYLSSKKERIYYLLSPKKECKGFFREYLCNKEGNAVRSGFPVTDWTDPKVSVHTAAPSLEGYTLEASGWYQPLEKEVSQLYELLLIFDEKYTIYLKKYQGESPDVIQQREELSTLYAQIQKLYATMGELPLSEDLAVYLKESVPLTPEEVKSCLNFRYKMLRSLVFSPNSVDSERRSAYAKFHKLLQNNGMLKIKLPLSQEVEDVKAYVTSLPEDASLIFQINVESEVIAEVERMNALYKELASEVESSGNNYGSSALEALRSKIEKKVKDHPDVPGLEVPKKDEKKPK